MKIKDLPNGLRKLAESKIDVDFYHYSYFLKSGRLLDAFLWEGTKEGDCFWSSINDGDFKPYYELIEIKDLDYWKSSAEENYINTPISVLKYISKLEEIIQKND